MTRRTLAQQRAHNRRTVDYELLLRAQGGRCALCANVPKEGGRRFHIDHDHKTGVVRGLLCFACNRRLPAGTDSAWLRRAALYVEHAERKAAA